MSNTITNMAVRSRLQDPLRGTELEVLARRRKSNIESGADTKSKIDAENPLDSFTRILGKQVDQVNDTMIAGDNKVQSFIRGEETSIHEVMIAMSKADLSFKLMANVGRKVIEAYTEILRTPV
jgi:flagellar hook-basal body complex protein FliE